MLILREDHSIQTAARHFIHHVNGALKSADSAVAIARAEQGDGALLQEAYPDKLFSQYENETDRVNEAVERFLESDVSMRAVILEVSSQFNSSLIAIEVKVAQHKGVNAVMDRVIDEKLIELFEKATDMAGFIEASRDAKTAKVQSLLDNPSPTTMTKLLDIEFTQKSATDAISRTIYNRYVDLVEAGDGDADSVSWEDEIVQETEVVITDVVYEPALNNAKSMFRQNASLKELTNTVIPKVSNEIVDKVSTKVLKVVEDQMVAYESV